jgi:hypothetical protein
MSVVNRPGSWRPFGEHAVRSKLYVAMKRGRESNSAYLYERAAEASEYNLGQPAGVPVMRRAAAAPPLP